MQAREQLANSYHDIAENALWQAGKVLAEGQDDLAKDGYGCFQEWAESRTKFGLRTVYRLISVYRSIPETVCANLSQSKSFLYALAAAPEPVRDEALQKIEDGDLIAVKKRLGHGQFLDWLNAEFEMTERTARRFMDTARSFGDKSDIMSNFNPTILYALASPSMPDEVRDEVIEKAEQGESVTLKDLNTRPGSGKLPRCSELSQACYSCHFMAC